MPAQPKKKIICNTKRSTNCVLQQGMRQAMPFAAGYVGDRLCCMPFIRGFWSCSDLFGSVRMRLDAFGCTCSPDPVWHSPDPSPPYPISPSSTTQSRHHYFFYPCFSSSLSFAFACPSMDSIAVCDRLCRLQLDVKSPRFVRRRPTWLHLRYPR